MTGSDLEEADSVAAGSTSTDRWKSLDFGPPPSGVEEPDSSVLVEYVSGGLVALITLNRPHADNAITTEMGSCLTEVVEAIAVRPAVRVVMLTGAGERAFSVGSDLRQRKNMTKEDWLRQRQDFDRTLYTLRELRKPIFAAVNGVAYGGGSEIAQSTDFIIASENATFATGDDDRSRRGWRLTGVSAAVLPPGRALQMLMTGDPITAQEAYLLGMVNEIHAQAELVDAVHRIAEKIASNSPTAVQAVKRAVQIGRGQPTEQAIAIMMEAHWRSAVHPDRIEGIGAFNENRDPSFQRPRLLNPRGSIEEAHEMAVADDLERQRAALTMIHAEPFNAEAPPEALEGDITPTALHYVRSNFPVPDHDGTLEIAGAVENPLTLTLDDLRALPPVERVVTLEAPGTVDSR